MPKNNIEQFENILEVQGINAKGFGTIAKMVMLDQRLSIESKAIYSYFCSYAGNGSSAFPSVSKIIHDLNISKTRYYKHFEPLKELGYIQVRPNKTQENKFTNNIYTLVFNPKKVESEKPCPSFEDTGKTKKPCPSFGDTGNKDTNINNTTINNISLNNNNNVTTDINNDFNVLVERFKDTTTQKVTKSNINKLKELVDTHGYEFVNHAITRTNKDININYLTKVLNSSSYQGKSTIEEVEQAIKEYNKPKATTRKPRVIRKELVPNWLNAEEEQQPTNTVEQQVQQAQSEPQQQTKSVDEFINEWKDAPYNTIMFQLEQNGYDRTIELIQKVMSVKGMNQLF